MRPTLASNNQLGGALEFLLLVVEKKVFRDFAMARHPLPNTAWRLKAFSVPRTNLHHIIPNSLSMFKSEHFEADRGIWTRDLAVIFKNGRGSPT
jgi:hypothetical protein